MKRKVVSMLLVTSMLATLITGCGSTDAKDSADASTADNSVSAGTETATVSEGGSDEVGTPFSDTVKISLMNSKPEITDALEAGAEAFGKEYNVDIEIYETDSPGDTISQKYAAGDAPTIAILDIANIRDLAGDKILDLSNEKWCEVGGNTMGGIVDGKVYGMPLTVEGMCILYNKTAIEDLLGKEFVAEDYTTLDEFSALLDELKAAGMETPFVLNAEDWSIGQKGYQFVYDYQDGTEEGAMQFLNDVHDGKTTFEDNDVFNKVYDAFDLFIENNINKDDPLAADYDLNASYVAEGDAAFWLNGTWAWPDFEPYAVDGNEYDVMPFPINDQEGSQGKIVAGATKFAVVDAVDSSEEQQEAAKMFLNWLVFTDEGQDTLINQCGMVTAFTNISLEPNNPFNVGLKRYIDNGMTIDGANYMPSDHRSVLAANMQAYLDGKMTRQEIAEKLDEYWTTNTPVK